MGTHDLLTEHLREEVLRRKSRVLFVASRTYVDALKVAAGPQPIPGMRSHALEKDDAITDRLLSDASLLVVEVDPTHTGSMRRLADVRSKHPDLPVVAAVADTSVGLVRTLVREGISDVVSLPIEINEMLQVALDAAAKQESSDATKARLAPLVAVVRSTGGCGATSVATHLAAELGALDETGRGAVLADLDLQFGSATSYLSAKGRGDISTLLAAGERLDEDLLNSATVTVRDGFAVIAAPQSIMPLEAIDTDQLLHVIQLLRRRHACVVLDLPANWTNWTLSAVAAADVVLLVTELSIASLRQARRRIDLFRSVGIDRDTVQVVVNRVEKKLFRTIGMDDVARTLDVAVLGGVALEAPLVSNAQEQGHLAGDLQRKSKFQSDIGAIAASLRAGRLAKGN